MMESILIFLSSQGLVIGMACWLWIIAHNETARKSLAELRGRIITNILLVCVIGIIIGGIIKRIASHV